MNNYVKIIATLIIGFTLAITFSAILEKGLPPFYDHKHKRMKELFVRSTPYDIVFLGSSRTWTSIDPVIIDSITGLNTYNAGMEGSILFEFKLVLDGYLETHPSPKQVILNIDPQSFSKGRKMFFPVQYFWALQNKSVEEAVSSDQRFRYYYIKQLSFLRQIYYSDYIKGMALKGLLGRNETSYTGFVERKGYSTNGNGCADTGKRYEPRAYPIQKEAIGALQAIIDTCKKRNITLTLTYSPEYMSRFQAAVTNFNEFLKTTEAITRANNIPFYRFDSLAMYKEPCYFIDYIHMNVSGAAAYSRFLGEWIASQRKMASSTGQ